MEKLLFANPDNCTGCNRCAYICSAAKEGAFVPTMARIKVTNIPFRGYSVPHICFHCPKADCMEACPSGAFSRNQAGAVEIDSAACSGCGACVRACPYGMVEQDGSGMAYKCDLCGGEPACVKECHAEALCFQPAETALIKLKASQMKTRTKDGSPRDKRQHLAEKLLKGAR